jgi:hypothetical protein
MNRYPCPRGMFNSSAARVVEGSSIPSRMVWQPKSAASEAMFFTILVRVSSASKRLPKSWLILRNDGRTRSM